MSDQSSSLYERRPSLCRNCGAIVAAGETVCPQCGANLSTAVDEMEAHRHMHDREAMRFARAVLSRPYTFTILFLVANLFVFMLMWSSSGFGGSALLAFPEPVLVAYGAKLNYLINARPSQWWRFVTPIFIHVNLPHILINMWSLWVIGPFVEKLYGSAKFVFFWVLTGVAGVVASYLTVRPDLHVNTFGRFLFKNMDNPSAGASGALFGLVGVLFVFGIKFRHELPEGFKRAFGTGMLPMILLNLFIGYVGRGFIDNAAHLGGFTAGALAALFVGYKRPGERAAVSVFWHVLQVASLALVALSFMMVVRNFPKEFRFDEERVEVESQESEAKVAAYLKATNEGEKVFIVAFNKGDTSAVDEKIDELKRAPSLDETADSLRNDLISLLERVRKQPPTEEHKMKASDVAARKKLMKDFQAWQDNHIRWAKENSQKYHLKIDEEENGNSPQSKGSDSNNRTTKD